MSTGDREHDGAHGWVRTPMSGKYFKGISPSALNKEFAGMAVKPRRHESLSDRPTEKGREMQTPGKLIKMGRLLTILAWYHWQKNRIELGER